MIGPNDCGRWLASIGSWDMDGASSLVISVSRVQEGAGVHVLCHVTRVPAGAMCAARIPSAFLPGLRLTCMKVQLRLFRLILIYFFPLKEYF